MGLGVVYFAYAALLTIAVVIDGIAPQECGHSVCARLWSAENLAIGGAMLLSAVGIFFRSKFARIGLLAATSAMLIQSLYFSLSWLTDETNQYRHTVSYWWATMQPSLAIALCLTVTGWYLFAHQTEAFFGSHLLQGENNKMKSMVPNQALQPFAPVGRPTRKVWCTLLAAYARHWAVKRKESHGI